MTNIYSMITLDIICIMDSEKKRKIWQIVINAIVSVVSLLTGLSLWTNTHSSSASIPRRLSTHIPKNLCSLDAESVRHVLCRNHPCVRWNASLNQNLINIPISLLSHIPMNIFLWWSRICQMVSCGSLRENIISLTCVPEMMDIDKKFCLQLHSLCPSLTSFKENAISVNVFRISTREMPSCSWNV